MQLLLSILSFLLLSASVRGQLTYYKNVVKCLQDGQALLTFDGGPDGNNTQKLLENLKKENITGAFFLTYRDVEAQPGLAMQILNSGHIVGYRFEREWNLTTMSDEGLYNSIERKLDNLKKKLGKRPRYIRLNDEGEAQTLNDAVMTKLSYAGYVIVGTQVDAKDGNLTSIGNWPEPAQAVTNSLGKLTGNDAPIVRMHDTNWLTIKQAPSIIEQVKGKGFKLVNFTECMGESGPYFDEKGKIPSFYGDYPKLQTPPEDEGKIFSAQNNSATQAHQELWSLLLIMLYALLH